MDATSIILMPGLHLHPAQPCHLRRRFGALRISMNDVMARSEQLFGLCVLGGGCTARPGETVTFAFALRNAGARMSAPAMLVFALPPPWSALDPCEVAVAPLAPGDACRVLVRALAGDAGGAAVATTVQAELHVDGRIFGSNRVDVRIAGQPCFSGPGSHVAIESDGPDAFAVRVCVRNEGDAVARDVRIVVPVPPGFSGSDVPEAVMRDVLAPGDAAAFSYRIVPATALPARVSIDDAAVAYDGLRCALRTSTPLEARPAFVAPELVLERRGTRLDVRVRIANGGWAAAYDVPCTLTLPPGWRLVRGSLLVNGGAAVVRSDGDVHALAVPFFAPRSSVEIVAVATAAKPHLGAGEVSVACADVCTAQTLAEPAGGAVRIDARAETAYAEPGARVPIAIDVRGSGERAGRVQLMLDGTACWSGDVRPGTVTRVAATYAMPATCGDGETMTIAVRACDADGSVLADASCSVRAVDRPWLAIAGIAGDGDTTTVTLRNDGATSVREIRLAGDGGDAIAIAALAPGETASLVLDASRAHDGAVVAHGVARLALCAATDASGTLATATLHAPADAQTGAAVALHVRVNGGAAMRTLHVRAHALAGTVYVAGSARVNGCAVMDGSAGSPLFCDTGLALHALPAGIGVDVCWSIVPHRSGDHVVTADVSVNGVALEVAPQTIVTADPLPFGARTHALPFHIDAPTVHDPRAAEQPPARTHLEALPPPPEPSDPQAFSLPALLGITTALDLDPSRCAAIARVLRGSRGPGIIGHLPALAALFPATIASGDPACDAAFAQLARSVCEIYERLFVKLRIPGYDVTSADLDDAVTRNALLALFAQLDPTPGVVAAADERTRITATIAHERIARARTMLAGAADDAPYSLAAIALLLPRAASSGVAGAIGSYAALLADALDAVCAHAAHAVVAALGTFDARELDAARAVAIAVLGAASEPAPL